MTATRQKLGIRSEGYVLRSQVEVDSNYKVFLYSKLFVKFQESLTNLQTTDWAVKNNHLVPT